MAINRNEQSAEVDRNYAAFQRQLTELLQEHRDSYALMHTERVIAFYTNPGEAYREGLSRFGDRPFSIQEVTDEPIDLGFYSHVGG